MHNTLKNHHRENQLFTRRTIVLLCIIILMTLALILRLMFLQLAEHKRYTTLSKQNLLNVIPIEPTRGLIYDRNGILLAENIPVFNLEITPGQVRDLQETLRELKDLMHLSDDEIDDFKQSIRKHRRFESIPLRIKLSQPEVALFYVNQYRFPGVTIQARLIRHYPQGELLAHVVGYVGRLNEREIASIDPVNYSASHYIGKIGVERSFETMLHGKVGYEQVEIDASGRTLRVLNSSAPIPGEDLYLTIDSGLTQAANQAIQGYRGAVVALDPRNGQVLALVSTPSFDPNPFVTGLSHAKFQALQNDEKQPLYNRTLRGQYAPGSTIKPFVALGSLAMHINDVDYQIFDPGWYRLPHSKHIYHDWKPGGHGWISLIPAIVSSCDTYFYDLAVRLGIKRIHTILQAFGFGQRTDIGLQEELKGILPSPSWKQAHIGKPWYAGDTVITGIGQGYFLATPLQLARATGMLATRGKLMQTAILLKHKPAHADAQEQTPIETRFLDLKQSTWNVIFSAMHQVITAPSGTGWRFGKDTPYAVAAKTGTVQVISKQTQQQYANLPEKLRDHSSFIAFAPLEEPHIALAIVVENDPHAAPVVARKVMDYYFKHMEKRHEETPTDR